MTRPRVATPTGPAITGTATTPAPRDPHYLGAASASNSPAPSAPHEPSPELSPPTSPGLSDTHTPLAAHAPQAPKDPGLRDAPPPPTSHNPDHTNVALASHDSRDSHNSHDLAQGNLTPSRHDAHALEPTETSSSHASPIPGQSTAASRPHVSPDPVPDPVAVPVAAPDPVPVAALVPVAVPVPVPVPVTALVSGQSNVALTSPDSHDPGRGNVALAAHHSHSLERPLDLEPASVLRAPNDSGRSNVPPSRDSFDLLRSPRSSGEPPARHGQPAQVATRPARSPQPRGTVAYGGAPSRPYRGGPSRPHSGNPPRRLSGASPSLTRGSAPVHANSLGPLTGLGVSLMLGAGCAGGALLDMLLVGGPAWALVVTYIVACGYTATRVRRADWFSALVSPPLAFAAAVIMLATLMPSSFGPGALGVLATTFTLLAAKAKALYIGNAISAGVLLSRRIKDRRAIPGPRAAS